MKNNLIICSFVFIATFLSCSEKEITPASNPITTSSEAKEPIKAIERSISGTVDGTSFQAILRIEKFIAKDSSVYALGTLTKVKGKLAKDVKSYLQSKTFEFPVTFPNAASASQRTAGILATCDILFLQLGPLDLNLLGLAIHLDQVTLTIDALSGAGNLLGNLLCAIAGLFDPLGFITNLVALVDLLNDLIALIGTF